MPGISIGFGDPEEYQRRNAARGGGANGTNSNTHNVRAATGTGVQQRPPAPAFVPPPQQQVATMAPIAAASASMMMNVVGQEEKTMVERMIELMRLNDRIMKTATSMNAKFLHQRDIHSKRLHDFKGMSREALDAVFQRANADMDESMRQRQTDLSLLHKECVDRVILLRHLKDSASSGGNDPAIQQQIVELMEKLRVAENTADSLATYELTITPTLTGLFELLHNDPRQIYIRSSPLLPHQIDLAIRTTPRQLENGRKFIMCKITPYTPVCRLPNLCEARLVRLVDDEVNRRRVGGGARARPLEDVARSVLAAGEGADRGEIIIGKMKLMENADREGVFELKFEVTNAPSGIYEAIVTIYGRHIKYSPTKIRFIKEQMTVDIVEQAPIVPDDSFPSIPQPPQLREPPLGSSAAQYAEELRRRERTSRQREGEHQGAAQASFATGTSYSDMPTMDNLSSQRAIDEAASGDNTMTTPIIEPHGGAFLDPIVSSIGQPPRPSLIMPMAAADGHRWCGGVGRGRIRPPSMPNVPGGAAGVDTFDVFSELEAQCRMPAPKPPVLEKDGIVVDNITSQMADVDIASTAAAEMTEAAVGLRLPMRPSVTQEILEHSLLNLGMTDYHQRRDRNNIPNQSIVEQRQSSIASEFQVAPLANAAGPDVRASTMMDVSRGLYADETMMNMTQETVRSYQAGHLAAARIGQQSGEFGGGSTRPVGVFTQPTRPEEHGGNRAPPRASLGSIIGTKGMPKDLSGQFVAIFGKEKRQMPIDECFLFPIGCTKDSWNNDFVICDTGHSVVKIYDAHAGLKSINTSNFNRPSAVVALSETLYAVRDDNSIQVFDKRTNELVTKCGEAVSGERGYGLAVDTNGNLVTLEMSRRRDSYIGIYDPSNGRSVARPTFTSHQNKPNSKCRFIDAYGGHLFVSDLGASRIYDVEIGTGQQRNEFGGQGREAGRCTEPSGITADSDGNLFIGDSRNDRVQIFSSDGQFMGMVKFDYPIKRPSGLHLTSDGYLMVMNYLFHYVALFKLGPLNK